MSDLYLSKNYLADLNIISHSFPQPMEFSTVDVLNSMNTSRMADCGCPLRQPAPDPPTMPFPSSENNVDKLKEFIINYYSTSTMNMCPHQTLPEVAGPALHFTLKSGARPYAVHTPAVIPIHWKTAVKEQLDRDVEMGIIAPVSPNEPVTWQHRMVVVRR